MIRNEANKPPFHNTGDVRVACETSHKRVHSL